MKKVSVIIALLIAAMTMIEPIQAQTPVPARCKNVKVIPNRPNPLVIHCASNAAPNCGGYCTYHCNGSGGPGGPAVAMVTPVVKRQTCNYYKSIPNSPRPIIVNCGQEAVSGCGGYCQTHCSGGAVERKRKPGIAK